MKIANSIVLVTMIFLLASNGAPSDESFLPQGWRVPRSEEVPEIWRKDDEKAYLTVDADFNGDGIRDVARLLISDTPARIGLFAFVLDRNGKSMTFLLDIKSGPLKTTGLGITKVAPGTYTTACGKGLVECGENEKREVVLHNEGIDYFKIGSANMYIYWNNSKDSFEKAFIND